MIGVGFFCFPRDGFEQADAIIGRMVPSFKNQLSSSLNPFRIYGSMLREASVLHFAIPDRIVSQREY